MTSKRWSPAWVRAREVWDREVRAGNVTCQRCRYPIAPDEPWDLGHPDDMPHITHGSGPDMIARCHPEHRRCSRGAAAVAVRQAQAGREVTGPGPGRLW